MGRSKSVGRVAALAAVLALGGGGAAWASDHLDTPSVIADPRADIGDIFAWTSPDGRRLNLVMTIVGQSFSDRHRYRFHVDSGPKVGQTSATTSISCRFVGAETQCEAGKADWVRGDASRPEGLEGRNRRLRVFAGLRDDPFFNNVRGTRDAYNVAAAALKQGAKTDAAGCPAFDAATARTILSRWRMTEGGPGKNLLAGWTPASLVLSVDLDVVNSGGEMLAVWAETADGDQRIDRMGRPLTGNALLATLDSAEVGNALKERYNRATPATSDAFVPEIEKSLGLYDGLDGRCGDQLLADLSGSTPSTSRYLPMAILLADDRLWINSKASRCTQFFAVELAALAGRSDLRDDCGGRTPNDDAVDVYRSLLVSGAVSGVDDGVDRDDREHSTATFPFLAPPASGSAAAR
ncbi:DUF4331 family protein [Phenylobacterium sp.]|uniref:DUF4331 family protein n=1 Tax=Phenylobacterium sp. TaxID=1871053 RepID=UPI00286B8EBB|nr:DUF4331 family protein [Phenylobacterium sp.]